MDRPEVTGEAVELNAAQKVLKELAEKRAKRKAGEAAKRELQEAIDRGAIDALLELHGESNISIIETRAFKEGVPVIAAVLNPGGTDLYKRYTSQVRTAKGNPQAIGNAQDLLGEGSIIYPEGEALEAMKQWFPGLVPSAYVEAIKLAELAQEDEKKG